MDNRPAWVPRVEAALARGVDAYKEAAELIVAAMEADPSLTQATVAQHLGHKPPWVSTLLKWFRAGCDPAGVFAAESAARRAKARDEISSTKYFEDYADWPVFDPPPIDASDATRRVLAARAMCAEFSRHYIGTFEVLTADAVRKAYEWLPGDERRLELQKLYAELEEAVALGEVALDVVRAGLQGLPQVLAEVTNAP